MKPLLPVLGLLLATYAHAKTKPKPLSEALMKAACESKGGLLMRAPDDAGELPESLFGPSEPAAKDAPAGRDDKDAAAKPKRDVLHMKARGKDSKKAKADCRRDFSSFYERNGDLSAAPGPEVAGEVSQADRVRLLAVLERFAPLQPLKDMTRKSIKEQQAATKHLFDGASGAITPDELGGLLVRAEEKLDRRVKDAAARAVVVAVVHARDEMRKLQTAAGEPLSPDLRSDPAAQAMARGSFSPPRAPSSAVPYEEPRPAGAYTSALKDLALSNVPAPSPVPTGGLSRGSILADVKAALSGLGVTIMGRDAWRARFGADARQHKPTKITVHHSAGSPSHTDANVLSQIAGWEKEHVAKGFGRMGYHWVINNIGTVVEGQGTELVGSHTANNNDGNVGICLSGNFDRQQPTEKMLASLAGLMGYITTRYNMDTSSPNFVRGHEFYSRGRICPGVNLMSHINEVRGKAVALAAASKGHQGVLVAAVVN